jgi:hypothetical protein
MCLPVTFDTKDIFAGPIGGCFRGFRLDGCPTPRTPGVAFDVPSTAMPLADDASKPLSVAPACRPLPFALITITADFDCSPDRARTVEKSPLLVLPMISGLPSAMIKPAML